MAQDLWTLWEKAGSQATHTQSLAHEIMQVTGNVAGCTNAVLGLPREMSAVNTKRCTGCTNAVSVCGCLQGSPCRTVNEHRRKQTQATERMDEWMDNTVHGLPVQSHGAAAFRAVPAALAMILAHMVMNGGK